MIGIIGILLVILIPFIRFVYNRRRKLKALYEVVWKKSSSLKPKDILRERLFYEYYYQRPEDNLISKSLNDKKNVLIIGPPLSGKSRAVYQTLVNLNKPHNVIIPRCTDINLETFSLPRNLKFWRDKIIFIDDLHRFVEQQNFEHLFRASIENNVVIVATYRSKIEQKKVKKKMADKNINLETIFEVTIELPKVSKKVGREIAEKVGIAWGKVKFDGNVGSIFMRLGEMEKRFDECTNAEKTILRAIRSLYISGVYKEHQLFPVEWIKIVTKKDGLEGKDFEWAGWLENLRDKEFIKLEKDKVWAEEAYLEYIVRPKVEMSDLDVFREMIVTFSKVPEALFKTGIRAYEIGTVKLEKVEYMKTAIRAYEEALNVYTLERFPMDYAMTQNNLGNAYNTLAEVEAKAENCKRAIRAYEEALKVRTLERFPMQHATTQNNLGTAYRTLAEVEAKAENCKRAIRAYEEALNVLTKEEFPEIYPLVKSNLRKLFDFCRGE